MRLLLQQPSIDKTLLNNYGQTAKNVRGGVGKGFEGVLEAGESFWGFSFGFLGVFWWFEGLWVFWGLWWFGFLGGWGVLGFFGEKMKLGKEVGWGSL